MIDKFNGISHGNFTITKFAWRPTHWYDTTSGSPAWKLISSPKDPGWKHRNGGVFTREVDIKAHINLINFNTFYIQFPDTDKNYPGSLFKKDDYGQLTDNGFIIGLTVVITGIACKMTFNGAALRGTIWMNTFAGEASDIGTAVVILHELGHNMGQVYADKSIDATFGRPPSKKPYLAFLFPKVYRIVLVMGGKDIRVRIVLRVLANQLR